MRPIAATRRGASNQPRSLGVFGRLPYAGASGCTKAGVRKASKEETAGAFAPAAVSGYGDLTRGSEFGPSLSDGDAGRVSGGRVILSVLVPRGRVPSR